MKQPTRLRNALIVTALYSVTLLAVLGCPQAREEQSTELARSAISTPLKEPVTPDPDLLAKVTANDVADKAPIDDSATQLAAASVPAPSDQSAYGDKPKFDPIQVNGKFFVDWTKPQLTLVITGLQDGYLEPCGCAGLENQKGGMNRRHALFEQLREKQWPLAAVDVGNQVRRFGEQAEIQFALSAEALKKMGYNAVTFGPADLRLSAGDVAAAAVNDGTENSMFVCANVSVLGLTPKFRIFEAGGMKIGVTGVLGETYQKEVNNPELEIAPLDRSLAAVSKQLAECDLRVLLAHATKEETLALAKKYPDFQVVVTAEGGDEPPYEPQLLIGGKTHLIEVGHKGKYAVVLGFYSQPKKSIRYQRVALDSRFPNTAEMQQLMVTYQQQLQSLGWSGLGLRPIAHPRKQDKVSRSGEFVGAESCKDCHKKAYGIWSKTKHAHATESLTKASPPRQFDPECISCHSAGWNPQEHFPYATGFDSLERTAQLAGNQCENCHGPGGGHIAAEAGRSISKRDEQRTIMKLTTATAEQQVCMKCHDPDNSPEFHFDKYWPKVEHKGKD